MSDTPVRLRPDLEKSEQLQQGQTYLVVKDPVTRRYFRFTERQAAILELMETPIDPETLSRLASEKLGGSISPATIAAFFDSLEKKRLTDTPVVREALDNLRGRKQEDHNLLYWKLGSINPERIFDWLIPRTKWAFSSGFHLFAALSILAGMTISITNWDQMKTGTFSLFSLYGLLLIWPVMFAVITIHEFAHGLVCRHYGGKVHEIGFMLIYFQPAFYCDVSDSWMFTSRRERMWVTFAGGYTQFIIWGLCTILWRITDPQAFINHVALVVVLFSGLQSLLNFNPLIKLDGYYMLSDYLEIPNLRRKSLDALWRWLSGANTPPGTPRETRALFIYGSMAMLFSTSLLLYLYSSLYQWATATFALAGLVGFLMFSTITLQKTAVEPLAGVRAVARRAMSKRVRNLVIVGALALTSYLVPWELKISAPFHILPEKQFLARAKTPGAITKINVREGTLVHKGQTLAMTSDFENEKLALEYTLQLRDAELALKQLEEGPRSEELNLQDKVIATLTTDLANVARNFKEQRNQLAQELNKQETELRQAQSVLNRTRKLDEGGLVSRNELEKDETEVAVAQSNLELTKAKIASLSDMADSESDRQQSLLAEAVSRKNVMLAGSSPVSINRKKEEIGNLKRLLQLQNDELEKRAIVSPIDGFVTTPFLEQKLDSRLEAGEEFCSIQDTREVTAVLEVPEVESGDVQEGFPVHMTVRSLSTTNFEGIVNFKAMTATTVEGQRVVVVRSTLRNENQLLTPNTTGVAKIYCGKRRIIELLTRRFRRWVSTDLWNLLPF